MNPDRLILDLKSLASPAPAEVVNLAITASGVVDGYVTRESPLGTLYVAFNPDGVTAVDLAESDEAFEDRFASAEGRQALRVDRAPKRIERHLDRAIETGRPGPLPLDLSQLTEFQQAVLNKAAEIPAGEVRPYGWIAKEIGSPGAGRAVGSALARNPVPVIVPCHRVVRSDGHIGKYSLGGPDNKRALLEAEGLDVDEYSALADRGVRFTGSDTTKIFCHPTCGPATRTTEEHQIEFRTAAEAYEAGYRPCKVCRPVAVA